MSFWGSAGSAIKSYGKNTLNDYVNSAKRPLSLTGRRGDEEDLSPIPRDEPVPAAPPLPIHEQPPVRMARAEPAMMPQQQQIPLPELQPQASIEQQPAQPINPMSSVRARNVFGKSNPPTSTNNVDFGAGGSSKRNVGQAPPPKLMGPRDTSNSTSSVVGDDDNSATRTYRDFLQHMPNESDPQYKHTKMDKLRAVIGAMTSGSPEGAYRELDRRYNTDLSDYKVKAGILQEGARVEDSLADNRRQRAVANAQIENYGSLAESRKARGTLNDFKARHPNSVFKSVPGGNIMAFDPQNPGKPIDTGVASGVADAATMQEYKIDQIDEQGDQARQLEGKRQSGRVAIEKLKIANPNYQYIPVKGGNWMAVNKKDPSDFTDTGVESGISTDEQMAEERVRLKQTPGAGTETVEEVTGRDSAGQPTGIKRTRTQTAAGRTADGEETVTMIDANGKEGQVRKSRVAAAEAAGYKKK